MYLIIIHFPECTGVANFAKVDCSSNLTQAYKILLKYSIKSTNRINVILTTGGILPLTLGHYNYDAVRDIWFSVNL